MKIEYDEKRKIVDFTIEEQADYGQYPRSSMTYEEAIDFANDILDKLQQRTELKTYIFINRNNKDDRVLVQQKDNAELSSDDNSVLASDKLAIPDNYYLDDVWEYFNW